MSKIDDVLNGKVNETEVEVKGDKTVRDASMTEPLKIESDNVQKEEGVKEAPTHDASGKLILTNAHLHNMGQNLYGTMMAVKHMQNHMDKIMEHLKAHNEQTHIHEQVLHHVIKKLK